MTDLSDLEALQVMRRYYRWKHDLVRPFLGSRILEIGCGNGLFLERLAGVALAVGVDRDDEAITRARARLAGHPELEALAMDALSAEIQSLATRSFDTVVFMSSIEEIEDDARALAGAAGLLPAGGRVVIFASALPGMTGELDRAFGQRRYRRAELAGKLAAAGLTVVHNRYANLLGALGWLWDSGVRKRREMTADLYRSRDRVVPFARLLDALTGPLVGRSIVGVGVKP